MLIDLAPLFVAGPPRRLHLSRRARLRYGVESDLFGVRGTVLFADLDAARRLAERINEAREARRYPELAVRAGELFAAGIIHELQHLLIERLRDDSGGDPLEQLLGSIRDSLGREGLDALQGRFVEEFPTLEVERGGLDVAAYLGGESDGVPNRRVVFEELLLLRLANSNPALERFRELFDDSGLRTQPGYEGFAEAAAELPVVSDEGAKPADPGVSLFDLLAAPAEASPTSLEGQLDYIRRHWQPLLGERMEALLGRLLLGLDVLAEERKTPFGGAPEIVEVPSLEDLAGHGPSDEYERFSPDATWMPRLVLLAKSSYVWLDQLSQRYAREISRLDQIPDEELDELAQRGFTGLWLIGLWERSEASRRIKHLRGQSDAVASAYALYDYRIAEDLGGEPAYRDLRERAWQRGIRLASDMVPNHVGLDGRWVMEHPEWFVQLDRSPYPGYTFNGPDLSSDERVGIYLEDHYFDNSDAAVVFKRVDRATGRERFIYHGNDGTSMPWNDTAQLDYLDAEAREAVIQTILEVARRFPIIRFDAAMTLAKEHIQRLWYPEPGRGGAIPSRAEHGSLSRREFDRALPGEFWREVVDRVAREVPDTLLLAEAFWMMEGYFVRTLGMHRVYNSAFMNMLKREANGEYRQLLKNVLEFEPEVLGRFVNFMNNPDEDTAVAQFGKDDKYFGVCVVMATMPGLPMFGHGQVEGYEEKYGMEYRRARFEELPDPWLVERHRREIFPLLHRRSQFASVEGFRLYDFVSEDGSVDEDVLAYSNRSGSEASLVIFHNRYAEAGGRVHLSVPSKTREGEGSGLVRTTLFEGLGLAGGEDAFLVFRDHLTDLEHLVESEEVRRRGLEARLGAFRYHVLLDFREVRDSQFEPYRELCRELSGRGVASVQDAVLDLRLRPLFGAFGELLDTPLRESEAALAGYRDFLDEIEAYGYRWQRESQRSEAEEGFMRRLDAAAAHLGVHPEVEAVLGRVEAALLSWMALAPLGPGVYERYRLEQELSSGEHTRSEPYEPVLFAEVVPLLLDHAEAAGSLTPERLLARLLADERCGPLLRFNSFEGEEYFDRESYRILSEASLLAGSILQLERSGVSEDLPERLALLGAIEESSGYRVERLRAAVGLSEGAASGRSTGGRSGG